jgi:hypothetical protein
VSPKAKAEAVQPRLSAFGTQMSCLLFCSTKKCIAKQGQLLKNKPFYDKIAMLHDYTVFVQEGAFLPRQKRNLLIWHLS